MHTQPIDSVVIVGGGQSSARAAHALRKSGYAGRLAIIGQEKHLPYDRPPLSKSVLSGVAALEKCQLYDQSFYEENDIDLTLGVRVDVIQRQRKLVVTANGERVAYSHLILATGAEPRQLCVQGSQLPGVIYLRTVDDALTLKAMVGASKRIVVVGAGFIGLEVAASAVVLGCKVTVVELGSQALQRAVPEAIAKRVVAEHIGRGVGFKFRTGIQEVHGKTCVESVRLTDGTSLDCDCVVVGIGVIPAVNLARAAGLEIEDGICVDQFMQTSDPAIFAIGDVCAFPSSLCKGRVRLESWKNAEDKALVVAARIAGQPAPAPTLPWFWSDQYDWTLQVTGLPSLGKTTVERDLGQGAMLYLALDRDSVLVGASALGSLKRIARDMRIAQALIMNRSRVDPLQLRDVGVSLRSLMEAA